MNTDFAPVRIRDGNEAASPGSPGGSRPFLARARFFLASDLGHYVPFALVAAAVLALDQWSKWYVVGYVDGWANSRGVPPQGASIPILGGKVLIDPVNNSGAAFGVLPNQTILLTAVALAIVGALILAYRRLARGPLSIRIGLGMVLGGALGNLLDRVRLGHVIDFIDLRWWPVFNVADSCIVLGVAALIITLMVQAERRVEG